MNSCRKGQKPRLKIYSILRRLSIRNFMEYCVTALNEASSSSGSNKFDIKASDKKAWLLGKQYDPKDAEEFVEDIRSKLWITYRRNFPPIDDNARYTTDRGFGCMIRCGQMVLANALIHKNLGRDWRWCSSGLNHNPEVYAKILRLFQDREDCLFSIHNIVKIGQQDGKVVGEWFGPNTIAQALKRLASTLNAGSNILISIDAALDNVVVVSEVKSRFKRKISDNPKSENTERIESPFYVQTSTSTSNQPVVTHWTPGILFIQLRLGLNKINPLYFDALKKTFQFKNSLGIIGGRPSHALYLIGFTEGDIIYLDPHSTQQYVDLDSEVTFERLADDANPLPIDSTYHCQFPEKMPLERLDPSLALCFYFETEQDFDEWCDMSNDLLIKSEHAPMFEIASSRPSSWNIPITSTTIKSTHDSKTKKLKPDGRDKLLSSPGKRVEKHDSDNSQTANDEEEFEMLG